MKKIPLTQGKFAIVDDSDFKLVSKFRWYAGSGWKKGTYYAFRRLPPSDGGKIISMEKFMFNASSREIIDHADGDGLNNRRKNLRVANKSLNAANSKRRSDNQSGIKAVYFDKRKLSKPWRTRIRVNRREVWIGRFRTATQAHRAYVSAAKKYFGVFARGN